MKAMKTIVALFVIIVLSACADLKGIRNYAAESARFSAYKDLTTRFRDTYYREQPYLFGEADRLAQNNDQKRKAAYKDLIKLHHVVSLYMKTLAVASGDDAFDLSGEIKSLEGGIKAYPDFGIDQTQVDAFFSISRILTEWTISYYQNRAVRTMIIEGDAPLQNVLMGMISLVRLYKKTNANEKKTVQGLLDVQIQYADTSEARLLQVLARAHLQSKRAEYDLAERKYEEAEKGIQNIARGHKILLENIDSLSAEKTGMLIGKIAADIKTVRENILTLRQ